MFGWNHTAYQFGFGPKVNLRGKDCNKSLTSGKVCSSRLGKDVTRTGACTKKELEIDLTHEEQNKLSVHGSLRGCMFLVAGASKARTNSCDACNVTLIGKEGWVMFNARDLLVVRLHSQLQALTLKPT